MEIAKSKNVEHVGLMDENINEMGKKVSDLKIRDSNTREQLHAENTKLK